MWRMGNGWVPGRTWIGKTERCGPLPEWPERKCPSGFREPLGRPRWEWTLPWDTARVPPRVLFPPARVGWGPAFVCARAAGVSTSRGVGINGIAGLRSACRRFAAGRTRSGNNSVAAGRKYASSRRPRSGRDASGGVRPVRGQRRMSPRPFHHGRTPARGHAGEKILLPFVTGRAVTTRGPRPRVGRFGIAARLAAKPCSGSWTESASGCGATLPRAAASSVGRVRLAV